MTSLVKTPKPAPLPEQPRKESAQEARNRVRSNLLRGKTQTVFTGGGANLGGNTQRTLLGGQ